MTPQELFDHFRVDVDDVVTPNLWSDEEIFTYMDDAQKMFCRLAYGIADATTPAVVEVALATGEPFSDLHPSILQIRRAERASDSRKIDVVNFEDMDSLGTVDDDYGMNISPKWTSLLTLDQGTVDYMVIGMEANKARWVRVPNAADTVNLVVYRGPLQTITVDNVPAAFEIEEIHHLHLRLWMRHLAYSKQDADSFDLSMANRNEQAFRAYTAQAKTDWDRKRHKPRTVVYGGI